jgi:transposase
MYCDPILWKNVRECVLEDGMSRRGAARKFGLARNTVRKMLLNEMPPAGKERIRRRPVIGPHEATIARMVEERSRSGYGYSPRIRTIFDFVSNEENYRGSYSAVRDYVSLLQDGPVPAKISEDTWTYSSDVLFSIGHQKSALFLKAMSHGRQPVLSEAKVKSFAQKAMGYMKKSHPTLDKPLTYGHAKDWLHSIAAGTMTANAIALSIGETEDLEELLQIAGCGNRIKRNRALTILGSKAGFSIRSIAAALKIARGSCAKYVALYRESGPGSLLQRKPSANRKYDNSALKDAVFALFHEPPSNYDINRTT